jgi:ABC-type transport system substrate-binding protein
LFAGLADYDADANVVPDLAVRWEVADGGRTYRYFLREHVTMHDGEELTADDVKRSLERALHPSAPSTYASYFEGLVGDAEFAAGKTAHVSGIEVEGRYVVSFHLAEPDATFPYLATLAPMRPVCKTAGDRYADGWTPCGAGPFRLEAGGWKRGTSLRLVRNDAYFVPGLPYLDAIEWTYNMQYVSQGLRFRDGALDIVRDVTQADQARYMTDARWRSYGVRQAERSLLGESMNTRMPPFDNVEIRRAVAAAIDREQYRAIKPANVRPWGQAILPTVAGYDPSFEGQHYDLAAALDHMRKAGYPFDPATGQGGWPKPIEYVMYDQGLLVFTSQILQQQLAKIGLRIEMRLVSWPTYLALAEQPGRVAISNFGNDADFNDGAAYFEYLFTTSAIGPATSTNTAFYSNPRLDDLVARAHRELDQARRAMMYREANAIVCDEAPWAFTSTNHFYDIYQPYVHGFRAHPVWPMDLNGVWLDRAEDAAARVLGGGLR